MANVFNTSGPSYERDNINQAHRPLDEQPGYKRLKDIVKRVLAELRETSMHKYALLKSYGVDFCRDYYILVDNSQNVVTREFPVDVLKRVKLPDDYINYVKIGVRVGDHVLAFLRDEELALYQDTDDCGEGVANPNAHPEEDEFFAQNFGGSWWFSNPLNSWGEHTGGFYGYGNGRIKNSFTIDNGSIQLSSNITAEAVYMEYVSSSRIYGDDTFVPITAEEACKSYIKWKFASDDRKPNQAVINQRQREYSTNIKIAGRSIKPLTVEEIIYATRSALNMNAKM